MIFHARAHIGLQHAESIRSIHCEHRSHIVRVSALTAVPLTPSIPALTAVPLTPSIPAWMSLSEVQAELHKINAGLRAAAIDAELDQINLDLAALDALQAHSAPALDAAAAALGAAAADDEPVPLRRAEPNSARSEDREPSSVIDCKEDSYGRGATRGRCKADRIHKAPPPHRKIDGPRVGN